MLQYTQIQQQYAPILKHGVTYTLTEDRGKYELDISGNYRDILTDKHRVLKHFGKRWQDKKLRKQVLNDITSEFYKNLPQRYNKNIKITYTLKDDKENTMDLKSWGIDIKKLHNKAVYGKGKYTGLLKITVPISISLDGLMPIYVPLLGYDPTNPLGWVLFSVGVSMLIASFAAFTKETHKRTRYKHVLEMK